MTTICVEDMEKMLNASLNRVKSLSDDLANIVDTERVSLGDYCNILDGVSEIYTELDFQMYCFVNYLSGFENDDIKKSFKCTVDVGLVIEEKTGVKWRGWHEKWSGFFD